MNSRAAKLLFLICLATPSLALGKSEGEGGMLVLGLEANTGGDSSMTGTWGFEAGMKTRRGKGPLKLNLGAKFSYASGSATLTGVAYEASSYGGELMGGVAIFPLSKLQITPVLEGNVLVGTRLLHITTPPVGIDVSSVGITYGFQVVFAAQFNVNNNTFQAGVAYTVRHATQLANQSGFSLNAFAFEAGWFF